MQFVNEDDMDELFRKAAADYPLKTDASGWEKVQLALEEKEERRRPPFFWLLLLLPLLASGWFFIQGGFERSSEGNLARGTINNTSTNKEGSSIAIVKKQASATAYGKEEDLIEKKTEAGSNTTTNNDQPALSKASSLTIQTTSSPAAKRQAGPGSSTSVNSLAKIKETVPGTISSKSPSSFQTVKELHPSFDQRSSLKVELQHLDPRGIDLKINDRKSKDPQRQKRFYVGLGGAVDLTTVKWQKVEDAGFDLGIVGGYRFHPQWSVETGIFFSKKFYYTRGEYFNTKELYIPANSRITDASGYCEMWEWPLLIRRSLGRSWEVSGGLSSYFMKKEDYNLTYYYNNTGQSRDYRKVYEESSTFLFSSLRLSGAYRARLGNFGVLRVEPYTKIPLRKIGIGTLPLQSAGVQFTLVKEL